jgi:hypothetical protein
MSLRFQKSVLKQPPRYLAVCQRIQRVLLAKGYEVSLHECEDMWEPYSDRSCASWLILPDTDEEIADALID